MPTKLYFKTLNSYDFIKNSPKFINNKTTQQNIEIIECSLITLRKNLLTKDQIRDSLKIFNLQEQEWLTTGLPLEVDIINNLLRKLHKSIYQDILES